MLRQVELEILWNAKGYTAASTEYETTDITGPRPESRESGWFGEVWMNPTLMWTKQADSSLPYKLNKGWVEVSSGVGRMHNVNGKWTENT